MFKIKYLRLAALLLLVFVLASCAEGLVVPNEYENKPRKSVTEPAAPVHDAVPPIKENRISFLAAGDNLIHDGIYKDAQKRATANTPEYNFKPMYDDVASIIKEADISFINQETIMGGAELGYSGYPQFNSPQDLGNTLVDLGFDIINIANNHMLDKYEKGLANTIKFWESKPVLLLGAHKTKEDFDNIRILEYEGVKIAFLSYTYATNGISLPKTSSYYVPYIKDDDIKRQTALAKEAADLVFVSIHWGVENTFQTSAEQRRLARLMTDCGVDVVIGHHPHVIQPIEWLDQADGGRTLVIYSLGNLMSMMMRSINMLGGFVTFDIVQYGSDKPYIDNVAFIPTVFHYNRSFRECGIYLIENYTDDMAKVHGIQNYASETSLYFITLDLVKKWLKDTISASYIPAYLDTFLN